MDTFFRIVVVVLYVLMYFSIEGTTLTKGPFLQLPEENSILIVWEQDKDSSPSVFCGTTESNMKEVKSSFNGKRHEVMLSNLSINTEYYYYVALGSEKLSGVYRFRTIPEKGKSFNFSVMGDTRSDPVAHSNIVNVLLKEDIHFVINTGDLVADGEVDSQWTDFFNIEKELLARVPLFPVIGNHEVHDDKVDLFLKYFVNPVKSSGREEYYSVDYANVHLTVLDGHAQVDKWYSCSLRGLLTDDCFNEKQEKWLKEDIQKASSNPDIDHIIVLVHAGPYTSKEDRTGNVHVRNLMDFFKQNKVTAIISGHDHYYERGVSGNGIPYIISGGGGAPLYEIEKPNSAPHTVFFNLKDYHYLSLTVAGKYLRIDSKRLSGEIFDILEIGEKPECMDDSECNKEMPECVEITSKCSNFVCEYECVDKEDDEQADEIIIENNDIDSVNDAEKKDDMTIEDDPEKNDTPESGSVPDSEAERNDAVNNKDSGDSEKACGVTLL